MEDEQWNNGSQTSPLFGGHENWSQREESLKLNSTMKVKLTILLLSTSCYFKLFIIVNVVLL